MTKTTMKNLTLCLMTVLMLLLQLASAAPVRADGGTSPPATSVKTSTPGPAQVEILEPTIDTAQETTLETTTQTDVTEEMTLFEAAQAIPDDTNVVVLDQNGGSLPLASQAAAEVIANSDPVWCPAGQAPTPGTNGCTTSYATLADLVANEGGNIAADGTIWITSGPVPEAGNVTIDGLTYTAWSNYALTLQGGWSGASGDPNIGSNSVFSVPIQIVNWNNSLVLNNVGIENVVVSGTRWLQLQTNSGDITISNSSISNNSNTSSMASGIILTAPDTVTINNSNFHNNEGPTGIFSANLTINNSNFTNTQMAESTVVFGPTSECSSNTVSNVFISHSNFNNNSGEVGLTIGANCSQPNTNITIDHSSFNDNSNGAALNGGNILINDSTFNNNSVAGVNLVGNSIVNNTTFSGNTAGIIPADDVTLNDVIIANNAVGVEIPCLPDLQLTLNHAHFLGNGVDIGSKILDCAGTPFNVTINNSTLTISSQTEGEFALDCASVDGYSVSLLNGDLVQIFCPVSGRARISSLDNTSLPAPLPEDYSYASAFSLDILQNEMPIPVITEGGYLKTSFAVSALQAENTYSILYWDHGTWIPLKEFTLDENGSFQLNPDVSEDPREILGGVKLVDNTGSPRVEVSTNFPGIFVLAQH